MLSHITRWKAFTLLLINYFLKLRKTERVALLVLSVALGEFLHRVISEMHELVIHVIFVYFKGGATRA